MSTSTPTPTPRPVAAPTRSTSTVAATGPVRRVVAGSLGAGAVAAAVLVFVVLPSRSEPVVVGAALLAFAASWALLAALSARLTDRSQPWALVPAGLLALAGTALVAARPAEPVFSRLAWAWAPALVLLGVWVARQAHRSVPGRAAWFVHPVAVVTVLAGVGGTYQAVTASPVVEAGPAPGRMVDVGGHRLHLDCTGTGSPTVVLLNGLGETSPQWGRVAPALAGTTRVCTYDRAGQGWSEDSEGPADATTAVADLHGLLAAAGERGPFVLAGHSSGGVHALTYAATYPRDVSGMVLLDSSSPHQVELVAPFTMEYEVMRRALAVAPPLMRLGLGHLVTAVTTPALPGRAGEQAALFADSPRGVAGLRAEQAALPTSFRQAQDLTSLGATPLVVLTAQDNVDRMPGWDTAQDRLAALSTDARHTVADLDHTAFLEDPDGARLSVQAVTDVVEAVRAGTPLAQP